MTLRIVFDIQYRNRGSWTVIETYRKGKDIGIELVKFPVDLRWVDNHTRLDLSNLTDMNSLGRFWFLILCKKPDLIFEILNGRLTSYLRDSCIRGVDCIPRGVWHLFTKEMSSWFTQEPWDKENTFVRNWEGGWFVPLNVESPPTFV